MNTTPHADTKTKNKEDTVPDEKPNVPFSKMLFNLPKTPTVMPKILPNGTTVMALIAPVGENHYIEYFFSGSWHCGIMEVKNLGENKGEILNRITCKNTQKPFFELGESTQLKVMKGFDIIGLCTKQEALKIMEPIFDGLTDDENNQLVSECEIQKSEKADKMSRYEWMDYVINTLNIIIDDNKQFCLYEKGVYVVDKEAAKISRFYRKASSNGYTDAMLASIKNQLSFEKVIDPHLFNPDRNITNFENGLLNLKDGKLSPHTPTYISTIQIPHDYIANSKSDAIDIIINGILKPEDIKIFKEFIGFCMTLKINFKTAVMLIGDTHSGKSTLEKIIHKLIGEINISAETLQSLSGKFNMFSLKNKILNMTDELPSKTIYDNAPFKTITGGTEFVRGEEKQIQSGMFRQTSKILFSANTVPASFDKGDEAYLVRWKLISCDNYFDPDNAKTDKNILDHLTEEDYSQFGSECIELFMEVMKRGKFTGEKSEDEKIRDYLMRSDPVGEFAKIIELSDFDIKKTDMYEKLYEPWCKFNNIKTKPYNKFFEDFNKLGYKEIRHNEKGKKLPAVISSVKVSEKWELILKYSNPSEIKNQETNIETKDIQMKSFKK